MALVPLLCPEDFLEAESDLYTIRLPANAVLQREIEYLLIRSVGRPPHRPITLYDPGFAGP